MSHGVAAPEGFVADTRGRRTLIASRDLLDPLERAGLADVEGWSESLRAPAGRSGRGATVRVELSSGIVARLKQLRRGGWTGGLWRGRFAGARRPLDNLRLPLEARRRGIATPAPLALLLVAGPPGMYRAWLAVEDLGGALDLATCLRTGRPPTRDELASVMRLVRGAHDRGLEHRDLNLGNLMIRRRAGAQADALIIDLDAAKLHPGPLGFRSRQRALRRLERSHVKCTVGGVRDAEMRDLYYALYAADDGGLAARLDRGRRAGRLWIGLHRLGWRRTGRS